MPWWGVSYTSLKYVFAFYGYCKKLEYYYPRASKLAGELRYSQLHRLHGQLDAKAAI